jgi:hypothetical protein
MSAFDDRTMTRRRAGIQILPGVAPAHQISKMRT